MPKVPFINLKKLDKPALAVGETPGWLDASVLWSGYAAPESVKAQFFADYTLEISSDKPDIVSVERLADGACRYRGLAKGRAKLTAVLRRKGASGGSSGKDGVLFQQTALVQVVEKKAQIAVTVNGATYDANLAAYIAMRLLCSAPPQMKLYVKSNSFPPDSIRF